MTALPTYFDRAADALWLAMVAPNPTEESIHLDEALRLNSIALENERAKLAGKGFGPLRRNAGGGDPAPIGLQAWASLRRH